MKLVCAALAFVIVVQGNQDLHSKPDEELTTRIEMLEALTNQLVEQNNRFEALANQLMEQNNRLEAQNNRLEKEIAEEKLCNRRFQKRLVLGEEESVAFTAFLGHSMHNIADKQRLVFERVITNEGGFYNNTTGIFTAPKNGLYQFFFAIDVFSTSQTIVRLVIDGNHAMDAIAEGTSGYHNDQGCNAINIRLNRGQNVWLEHYSNNGNSIFRKDGVDFIDSLKH